MQFTQEKNTHQNISIDKMYTYPDVSVLIYLECNHNN